MCFLAAWLLARSLNAGYVLHGLTVGLLAALIDVAILMAFGAAFQWLFVASNAGRILAGSLGGFAGRSQQNRAI